MNLWPGPWSSTDLVALALKRVLAADPLLVATTGGRVVRLPYYAPKRSLGNSSRIVVAPIDLAEEGRISKLLAGTLRIGIVYEFFDPSGSPELRDDEPSMQSVMLYMRDIIQGIGPNLKGLDGDRLRCIKGGPLRFETLSFTPETVDDGGQTFFLALIAVYETIDAI